MPIDTHIERILRLYGDDCRPSAVEPARGEGFSGARLWHIVAPRGPLCLRRWPREHPTPARLEFIQAVLWHVDQEGFHRLPLPIETRHHHGYLWHAGHLWELTPWLAGQPDYRRHPSPTRLANALAALAAFHLAAATFPLPETSADASPGIVERRARLERLTNGGLAQLREAVTPGDWPELAVRAGKLLARATATAAKVEPLVARAAEIQVALQPCIRDIWHPHVLFVGDEVSGIVDFGALRADHVACDVARLLGSLAGDDAQAWQRGLEAYQNLRPLTADELLLVSAFDRTTVLMGGLQWLEWIYLENRQFVNRPAVLARIDEFLARLTALAESPV